MVSRAAAESLVAQMKCALIVVVTMLRNALLVLVMLFASFAPHKRRRYLLIGSIFSCHLMLARHISHPLQCPPILYSTPRRELNFDFTSSRIATHYTFCLFSSSCESVSENKGHLPDTRHLSHDTRRTSLAWRLSMFCNASSAVCSSDSFGAAAAFLTATPFTGPFAATDFALTPSSNCKQSHAMTI